MQIRKEGCRGQREPRDREISRRVHGRGPSHPDVVPSSAERNAVGEENESESEDTNDVPRGAAREGLRAEHQRRRENDFCVMRLLREREGKYVLIRY